MIKRQHQLPGIALIAALFASPITQPALAGTPAQAVAETTAGVTTNATAAGDWPQLGRDAQRTNYSTVQLNPPYCYAWKWYEAPMANRAQPIVVGNRLFIGSMDGALYARDATTGAPLWRYATNGPIRHSAGVLGNAVIASSHDGNTYALNAADGALLWKTETGASLTAPLIDEARGWAYVASSDGRLTALNGATGAKIWGFDAGAPIATSPSLSADGARVYLGSERVEAIAVNAQTGALLWRTKLHGQSLSERYPVVSGEAVFYRSQPLYFFHKMLHEGDAVLDQAGPVRNDWAADWAAVRPNIVSYLTSQPAKQTFFALNGATGASLGVAPVLYTTGVNEVPDVPVARNGEIFTAYRPRLGIQTNGGSVHVTTRYDAELGRLNLSTLDIAGLQLGPGQAYAVQFRMTSDEPNAITMGGDILWVDNWERVGGINVASGQLLHVGNVSNVWPECYGGDTCGDLGPNPFFPLSGSGPAYPFPSPRVSEGYVRPGAVIANNMLYWRVIEGGLAGVRTGTCGAPRVWTPADEPAAIKAQAVDGGVTAIQATEAPAPVEQATPVVPMANQGMARHALLPLVTQAKPLSTIVTTDLTTPVANPAPELVARLRREIQAMLTLANGQHLLPYYLERGFSTPVAWPYNSSNCGNQSFCMASIAYESRGNVYWHSPGELLLSMAQAYPYLDAPLQAQLRAYMAAESQRNPPLRDNPYNGPWLTQGVARELYDVPFRGQLNGWPPPGANISAIYAVWLWAKNTDDWSTACTTWQQAKDLFSNRRNTIRYFSDITGLIGYARLAQGLKARNCAGVTDADYTIGLNAALNALNSAQGAGAFDAFAARAANDYFDPRELPTGWSVPVFFGMTPEVGQFLRENSGGQAVSYLNDKQSGDGVRWWYLTRAGMHAEEGESSYMLPTTAWSHFLARAYVAGDSQSNLVRYLDRPWAVGDPYSIQKIVAAIHAK